MLIVNFFREWLRTLKLNIVLLFRCIAMTIKKHRHNLLKTNYFNIQINLKKCFRSIEESRKTQHLIKENLLL